MSLNDRQLKAAKPTDKPYKLTDEKGLFVLVAISGSLLFKLKYRFNGKEKKLSLGKYPDISLKRARELRDEAKKLLSEGIDPSSAKIADKARLVIEAHNSFKSVALDWLKTTQHDKAPKTQQKILSILERLVFPAIGNSPINDLKPPTLLDVLRAIEKTGAFETTRRTSQILSQIFRFAIATSRAERDPIPDLKGALQPVPIKHRAAITDPQAAGLLMVSIDAYQCTHVVKTALQLSALFFCRPGELRHLKWSDINEPEQRIEIFITKTKQDHIIPVCKQAKALLDELRPITGGEDNYIFPSARGGSRPMSENAIVVALRTMGFDKDTMTAHGFRAMARTLLDEVLGYRIDWIEQQLAHSVRDTNGRAYNRTTHLAQRKEMMQRWANYLDELKAQALAKNVITGNFKRA